MVLTASGLGAIHHRPFPMASGEMDRSEFIAFLGQACRNLAAFSGDGAVIYICPWTGLPRLVQRPEPAIGIGL